MNVISKPYFWPVFFLLAFVAALCFFYPVYQAVALIPALTIGIILIGNPRKYIFVYLFLVAAFPILQQILPMGLGTHLDELIGGAITFLILMNVAFRRINERDIYTTLFVFLLAWCALSLAFNRSSVISFVRFFMAYLLFIPVFQLSRKYLTRVDLVLLLKGGILLFWINVILNMGWYLGINPIRNEMIMIGSYVDLAMGTFGGCNYVAYFCAMLIYFLITTIFYKVGSKRFRRVAWVTLLMAPVQFYFTYTNHALLLFVITGIPLLIFTGLWRHWFAVVIVMCGLFLTFFLLSADTQVAKQFDEENLTKRMEQLHDSAKVDIYNDLTIKAVRADPYEWILGAGPGNGVGALGRSTASPMAVKYLIKYYSAFGTDRSKMQLTSITGNTDSGVLAIWGDIGAVGTLLYFFLFTLMLFKSKLIFFQAKTPEVKAFSTALFSSLLFLLAMCILFDVLYIKFFSYSLWAIYGVLSGEALVKKDSKMEQADIETPA